MKNPEEKYMYRTLTIGLILILLLSTAGCTIAESLWGAGTTTVDILSKTAEQQCKFQCDNHYKMLSPGCSCPDTPTPQQVNTTPISSGK